jgi:hypothetical protein
MKLGHVLEKFLTLNRSEFEKYRNDANEEPESYPNAFHYGIIDGILLRSQLDAYHPSLKRQTFDLKTRAVLAIRKDIFNYKENTWYKIRFKTGELESFEREYFDMLRASFLKYSLQARIGNMDGIFTAYHNTEEMFGFEYIPLEDLEQLIFRNSVSAEQHFSHSMQLSKKIVEHAIEYFPKRDSQILVTKPRNNVFVNLILVMHGFHKQ